MNGIRSRIGKSTLAVVIITCAVIFLVFGLLGSIGFVFSNGVRWFEGVDWSQFGFHAGRTFDVDESETASLDGVERIVIESVSSGPEIATGGDQVSASLEGTCRSFTDPVSLEVAKNGTTLTVRMKYPMTGVTSVDIAFDISIPSSFEGDLEVKVVSGDVVLEDPGFSLRSFTAASVSGDVRLKGVRAGSYKASTTSGTVSVADAAGPVKAEVVSGGIDVSMDDAYAFEASTVSGGVALALPSGVSFDVRFKTVSGSFDCDFSIVLDKDTRTETTGSVGAGGPEMKASTVSGSFRIYER